jgi:hypothetical protein
MLLSGDNYDFIKENILYAYFYFNLIKVKAKEPYRIVHPECFKKFSDKN